MNNVSGVMFSVLSFDSDTQYPVARAITMQDSQNAHTGDSSALTFGKTSLTSSNVNGWSTDDYLLSHHIFLAHCSEISSSSL